MKTVYYVNGDDVSELKIPSKVYDTWNEARDALMRTRRYEIARRKEELAELEEAWKDDLEEEQYP